MGFENIEATFKIGLYVQPTRIQWPILFKSCTGCDLVAILIIGSKHKKSSNIFLSFQLSKSYQHLA